jgi:hypothetical protein
MDERPLADGGVELVPTGELDIAAASGLEQRLDQLRAQHSLVRLEIDPNLAPQAMHILKLTGIAHARVSASLLRRANRARPVERDAHFCFASTNSGLDLPRFA